MALSKYMVRGFITFLREQRVVSLAIAFILGAAVNQAVSSLVQDVIQPAIGFIFGSPDGLRAYHFKSLMYGSFLANVIHLLIIAAVVYFVFKGFKLDRLDIQQKKE